ncbi:nadh dehydrogenase 1 beta subcomplex [Moniliophthora roreri MCA 2997]|uniref:NADH dehydrogenase [ubiquinone] 1 beta subcomplex subunit 11, mitochondrial n=1 Tax=Moniliophthora roreri (strain MCA 2997) TaxID=1381753 RepID=V2Y873_MONRO|nr:nadh dehydrogenase 1 beta subcomplex [Moniliophthora roreri MCA 2997]
MLPQLSARSLRIQASHLRGKRFASGGAPHFNEPSGWLFGEKPLPPGQKRVKEGWENIWYIGMFGSMAFAAVMLYYKPDTSVQTWALKEAKERMEVRGEKYKYEPSTTLSS